MSEAKGEIKFIVGGRYANRRGEYEVLEIRGKKMRVRYDDNTEQELTTETQARIARNMAAEAEQAAPYKGRGLEPRNEQFFSSLGFLVKRVRMLEAIVPSHALNGFISNYTLAKGCRPASDQDGLYIHEPEANKWGCELRVTFRATPGEVDSLDFGPEIDIVSDPSKPERSWRINNNGFWWRLLKFGFDMGRQQNVNAIEARIPKKYREHFRQGYAGTP